MKELLEHIVKSIVNNPDVVEIEEREGVDLPGWTILTIKVAEEDKGVVIGKKGRTINAIRDLITICAIRGNKRARVVLEDDEKPSKDAKESKEELDESVFEDEI